MKTMYAVLRLNTSISAYNHLTGKDEDIVLKSDRGYIPVYEKLEDAEKAACKGKYQIVAIELERE